MDYKELIERLIEENQSLAAYEDLTLAHVLEDAALAIETLLAERDAAIRDILLFSTGNHCRSCVHWENGRCSREGPKDCDGYSWWQWRGPQKGGV